MEKKICKILKEWGKESSCDSIIQFNYLYPSYKLIIYTNRVGYLIGKGGMYYNKYLDILKKEIYNLSGVEFVETNYYQV